MLCKRQCAHTELQGYGSDAPCHDPVRVLIESGLPKHAPTTSPYFSHPTHTSDQYSISFTLRPKVDIPGDALVFGNDFEQPIRGHLPPGFSVALGIVKRFIDPGIDGDPYADKPYLYGPALSSVNVLRVSEKKDSIPAAKGDKSEAVFEEGGDGDGETIRREHNVPQEASARKKYFLDKGHRLGWTFEKSRLYLVDFFNPYLDFNRAYASSYNDGLLRLLPNVDFALKLPGFSLSLMRYWDGQPLRYVHVEHCALPWDHKLIANRWG